MLWPFSVKKEVNKNVNTNLFLFFVNISDERQYIVLTNQFNNCHFDLQKTCILFYHYYCYLL